MTLQSLVREHSGEQDIDEGREAGGTTKNLEPVPIGNPHFAGTPDASALCSGWPPVVCFLARGIPASFRRAATRHQ
jgi:hypothetical protein